MTIQDSINALPSCGGIVDIPPGLHILDDSLLSPSIRWIRGAGKGATILKFSDNANPLGPMIFNQNYSQNNAHLRNLNNNIRISDLTIDCNYRGTYGIAMWGVSDVDIENVAVKNTNYQGMFIQGSNRPSIRKSTLTNISKDAIHLTDCDDYLVDHNYIDGSGDYGIEITAGGLVGAENVESGRGTVSNNHVANCVNFGIATRGCFDPILNPNNVAVRDAHIFANVESLKYQSLSGYECAFYSAIVQCGRKLCGG